MDETSTCLLEFTEVEAMPFEYDSPSDLQAPTSDAQPDKPSAGLESVSTQTGDEYITQSSSIPKHQPEYGPHKRFSRKKKKKCMQKNLVISKE